MSTPPCVGKSALFESALYEDHLEAKAICATCPMINACMVALIEAKRAGGEFGQPIGTWAGHFYPPPNWSCARQAQHRTRAEQVEAEDAAYTDQDALVARRAYNRGDRSDWARIGKRVYQRRLRRRARSAA